MKDGNSKKTLEGLRGALKQVEDDLYNPKPRYLEALFFPDPASLKKVVWYLSRAQRKLNICVFTITNNEIAKAILERSKAGVAVRIITDDECMK